MLSDDGDYALGAVPVLPTELALQLPLELPGSLELLDDVRAAEQLAADEDLRDRRPARQGRQLLADLRVGKDVDGGHRRACAPQRLKRALGVPAHHDLRRALHEE